MNICWTWDLMSNQKRLGLISKFVLTTLAEHLIALIENENLKVIQVHVFLLHKLHDSSWGTDNNMWWFWSLQDFDMFTLGNTSVETFSHQTWNILGESCKFFFDLICQLSDIAQNQNRVWLWVGFIKLLQDWNDKYCSFSHSRDSLANDISSNNGLRNTFLLHFWRMLKSTINDGSIELVLE